MMMSRWRSVMRLLFLVYIYKFDQMGIYHFLLDACKLPSVKGFCEMEYKRWYYNSTWKQCILFKYGGCLGNANNFDTEELCQKQCEPSSVAGEGYY